VTYCTDLTEVFSKNIMGKNGSMTTETNSFETIHLRSFIWDHSFETTTAETTFILDLFIWDLVFLRHFHVRPNLKFCTVYNPAWVTPGHGRA